MKIRYGFVTNSSSSSFILAFKNDEDFAKWEEWCDDLDYNDMKNLLMSFMEKDKSSLEEQKQKAIEFIEFVMTIDDLRDWMASKIDQNLSYSERWELERKLEKTQEYLDYKNELLKNEDIQKKIKKVQEAEKLCQGMIWDTQGGILEWAIRNRFLESEFWDWTVIVNNVG